MKEASYDMNQSRSKSFKPQLAALLLAAAIGTGAAAPGAHVYADAPSANAASAYPDLAGSAPFQKALQALVDRHVLEGYQGKLAPRKTITRAELAKIVALGLELDLTAQKPAAFADMKPNAWYAQYAGPLVEDGIMKLIDGKFMPKAEVSPDELVSTVAAALARDEASVRSWLRDDSPNASISTRGEAAYLVHEAAAAKPSAQAEVVSVRALNAVTLEVILSAPLTAQDSALDQAKLNFVFDNALEMPNIPHVLTGSKTTFILPTATQKPGETYSLSYKNGPAFTFTGSADKLPLSAAKQIAADTFELESLLADGITDYGNIVASDSGKRGGLDFILDEQYAYNGRTYTIIPSMRGRAVTLTAEGGQPITAAYIPYTQNSDGRQAPKFRLPAGQSLVPGVKYTVTSDWATVKDASFTAAAMNPLRIASVAQAGPSSIAVTLDQDPGMELFASRGVVLTAEGGTKLNATYRVMTRQGATGTFDLAAGQQLTPGTTYAVSPAGVWASAEGIVFRAK